MKGRLLFTITLICAIMLSLFPTISVSAQEPEGKKWVLVETKINPDNAPLRDERKSSGSEVLDEWTVTETSISRDWFHLQYAYSSYPDRVNEYSTKFIFDKPPQELIPGNTFSLNVRGEMVVKRREQSGGYLGTDIRYIYGKELVLLSKEGQGKIQQEALPDTKQYGSSRSQLKLTVQENELTGSVTGNFVLDETWAENPDADAFIIQVASGSYRIVWVYEVEGSQSTDTGEAAQQEHPDWMTRSEEYINSAEEIYVPDWLEWIKPKQTIRQRGVIIPGTSRDIYIYNRAFKRWEGPISSEKTLRSGDMVSTGPDSTARVIFSNQEGRQDSISVGRDTLLEIPATTEDSKWPTLWTVYEQGVKIKRAFFGEAPTPSSVNPFIVRTPTVVAGVRESLSGGIGPLQGNRQDSTPGLLFAGLLPSYEQPDIRQPAVADNWVEVADFIVYHDPETGTSTIHVNKGELDYYNLVTAGSESGIISGGHSLVIERDGAETSIPLSQQKWESLSNEYGLEEFPLLTQKELDRLFQEDGQGASSGINPVIYVVIGVVLIGAALLGLSRLRKKVV